jgi:hypothetical protein
LFSNLAERRGHYLSLDAGAQEPQELDFEFDQRPFLSPFGGCARSSVC